MNSERPINNIGAL